MPLRRHSYRCGGLLTAPTGVPGLGLPGSPKPISAPQSSVGAGSLARLLPAPHSAPAGSCQGRAGLWRRGHSAFPGDVLKTYWSQGGDKASLSIMPWANPKQILKQMLQGSCPNAKGTPRKWGLDGLPGRQRPRGDRGQTVDICELDRHGSRLCPIPDAKRAIRVLESQGHRQSAEEQGWALEGRLACPQPGSLATTPDCVLSEEACSLGKRRQAWRNSLNQVPGPL